MVTSNRNVCKIIYNSVNEVVLMRETELSTRVELVNRQKNTMILHLAKGQLRLQEFGMVI